MEEMEFHFQVEPLPEFMEEVEAVGALARPVVLVAGEHLYQVPAMQVMEQIEQMEKMV
jgi:hypothetical protein